MHESKYPFSLKSDHPTNSKIAIGHLINIDWLQLNLCEDWLPCRDIDSFLVPFSEWWLIKKEFYISLTIEPS